MWYALYVSPDEGDPAWTPDEISVYMGVCTVTRGSPVLCAHRVATRVMDATGGAWMQNCYMSKRSTSISLCFETGVRVGFWFCNAAPAVHPRGRPSWCVWCTRDTCPASRTHMFADGVLRSMLWSATKVVLLSVRGGRSFDGAHADAWSRHCKGKLGTEAAVVPAWPSLWCSSFSPLPHTLWVREHGRFHPAPYDWAFDAMKEGRKWCLRGFPMEKETEVRRGYDRTGARISWEVRVVRSDSSGLYAAPPFVGYGCRVFFDDRDWLKLRRDLANLFLERWFLLKVLWKCGHDVSVSPLPVPKELATDAAALEDVRARSLAACLVSPIVSRNVAGQAVRNMGVWIGQFL